MIFHFFLCTFFGIFCQKTSLTFYFTFLALFLYCFHISITISSYIVLHFFTFSFQIHYHDIFTNFHFFLKFWANFFLIFIYFLRFIFTFPTIFFYTPIDSYFSFILLFYCLPNNLLFLPTFAMFLCEYKLSITSFELSRIPLNINITKSSPKSPNKTRIQSVSHLRL